MAYLDQLPEALRNAMLSYKIPDFPDAPWAPAPKLSSSRIALITTAGLHQKNDKPFIGRSAEYKVIHRSCKSNDLIMSHISSNFDRTGFVQDWNLVFPLDRLYELAEDGIIGSVAEYHYSFMGAADLKEMEKPVREVAGFLKNDRVDCVLLTPV